MKKYCCGFMFNDDYSEVLLIRKNKPEWQQGKLNGIGGKLEEGETYRCAMVREFAEETGVYTEIDAWSHVCDLSGDDWCVSFWWSTGDLSVAKSMTDEQVCLEKTRNLPSNIIPNLKWLIPLAMDRTTDNDKIDKGILHG